MSSRKIKICGMKNPESIKEINQLDIDFMGFIFYPKSKRYIDENFPVANILSVPKSIKKVGVFVNESLSKVVEIQQKYSLDYVQLHADESPEYCEELNEKGIKIIKAFQIDTNFNFDRLTAYEKWIDLFVFDSPTPLYGGSGNSFNWALLLDYQGKTPFLLSGGLGLHNIKQALECKHPMLAGFDINSKIEIDPGNKDIKQAAKMQEIIRNLEG